MNEDIKTYPICGEKSVTIFDVYPSIARFVENNCKICDKNCEAPSIEMLDCILKKIKKFERRKKMNRIKPRGRYMAISVPIALHDEIAEYVKKSSYNSIAEFVKDAVREKMNQPFHFEKPSMLNQKISIIGIRSKSTSEDPTYLFSIESSDKVFLQNVLDMVKQTLWVQGVEINHDGRYHDE